MNASQLRSSAWFVGDSETAVQNRSALRSAGVDTTGLGERPVIGISNTVSDLNPCNKVLALQIATARQAVLDAGGIPVVFPSISLGEDLMKPTAMLYRNLLAIEIEEMIRSHPIDALIVSANCDKTIPGALMGAISSNVPTVMLLGGPKPRARFKGRLVGSGTDLWKNYEAHRTGSLSDQDWSGFEEAYSRTSGACNVMGTATTMSILTEVLGFAPNRAAATEANSPASVVLARRTGQVAVKLARSPIRPQELITSESLHNALVVLNACGGSTNAVVHLAALAGRAGVTLPLEEMENAFAGRPVLVDVMPAGTGFAQDFANAGGTPALLRAVREHLYLDTPTVEGSTMGAHIDSSSEDAIGAIRGADHPVAPVGLAMLRGNLAPDGAVIKVSAATSRLLEHRGPAVVFEGWVDMLDRIDDEELDVTADSVLILRNGGPVGGPGMPEWGMVPIPAKLARQGITDMVRVSDARMSGTSFGTVVLHASPESAVGGPLALIRDGDLVELSLAKREVNVLVSDDELEQRRLTWQPPTSQHGRGWINLYQRTVLQAPEGCDLDFLRPRSAGDLRFIEPTVARS